MKERKRKRISGKTLLSIIFFLIAAACLSYKLIIHINETRLQKERFTQAEVNAMRYINGKYGFDAEFSISDYNDKYDTENCGVLRLHAKYGDNEFEVIVKCDEDSDEAMDNFQYENIKAALLCVIQEGIPDGAVIDYSLSAYYPPVTEYLGKSHSYFAFREYFDGNNLDDVLTDCCGKIEMVFAADSVPELINEDKLKKWNINYEFTSFDSKEHLDGFIDALRKRATGISVYMFVVHFTVM